MKKKTNNPFKVQERPLLKLRVQFYRYFGEWRWRMRAVNGQIVGASTEGYKRKIAMCRNFRSVTGLDSVAIAFYKGASLFVTYWR